MFNSSGNLLIYKKFFIKNKFEEKHFSYHK